MTKAVMAVALAGTLGLAGVLVPRIAWSQGSAEPDGFGTCWGGDYGTGMMSGPSYRAGMWERAERGARRGVMRGAPGLGPIWRLDLSDAQRTQVKKIADGLRRANWAAMGKLRDARAKLHELESASEPDPKKVGAAYAELSGLRQDMLVASVQARNQARTMLTPAQRQQYDQWRNQGWGPDRGIQVGAQP